MSNRAELDALSRLRQSNVEKQNRTVVDDKNLTSMAQRLSLFSYLRQMWDYRHFVIAHARYKAGARNDDMFLGKLWLVLEPLLRIALYGTFFGLILNTSKGIDNFVGFLVIGIMFFGMLSRGLSTGSGLIQRSRAMMRTFKFPRASLVFGESVREFIVGLAPATIAVIAALALQWREPVSWTVILVVPLYFLVHIFVFGLMFIVARITAFLPDAKKAMLFVNRAWFYVSGVFFSVESVSRFNSVPELLRVMEENPAYRFLSAVRSVVMYGEVPTLNEWLILVLWSAGMLIVGFIFFWSAENKYVRVS